MEYPGWIERFSANKAEEKLLGAGWRILRLLLIPLGVAAVLFLIVLWFIFKDEPELLSLSKVIRWVIAIIALVYLLNSLFEALGRISETVYALRSDIRELREENEKLKYLLLRIADADGMDLPDEGEWADDIDNYVSTERSV